MLDMTEWDIKTTSNNCYFLIWIHGYHGVVGRECDHPESKDRYCSSDDCPIIIKPSMKGERNVNAMHKM